MSSHFCFSFWGQTPLLGLASFAPRPHWGNSVPQISRLGPFGKFPILPSPSEPLHCKHLGTRMSPTQILISTWR